MDLLERTGELATLDRLLAESAAGGRVAVLSGEAGAGKSTLAAAFTRAAGARAQTLWGACDPLLTPRALGPLHDIARGLGGALRDRIGAAPRTEVFGLLLDALDRPRQVARPVVVLEDLHWADEATLDMVAFLGRRLALCRALLVLTYRDDELGPDHPLRTVLAGLPRGLIHRVPLPALSREAVAQLAARAGRTVPDVFAMTGGNPLLVTEVLSGPAEDVPPTVRDLVLSRLTTISEPAREVARLVSVIPSGAEPDLLRDHLDAVEECLARGVLTTTGGSVSFRHELLRRAVEESLSPVRRQALHAEVLKALSDRPSVDPARLVHHAHHSGDAAAVLRWAPVAARRAAQLSAYRQAVAHYETALPLAGDRPPAERATLLEEYSVVAYHCGRSAEAIDARRAALDLRRSLGDEVAIGEGLRWMSRLSWWNGRPLEARDAAYRAVEVLEAQPPGRELAAAYSNLSQLFMLAQDLAPAIAWGARATELARRLGDLDTEAHAMINVGTARLQNEDLAGVTDLNRAYDLAVAAGLDDHAGRALTNLASTALDLGHLAVAEPALERVMPFLTARHMDGYHRHMLGHRARLRLARGDWTGALEDADEALGGPPMPGPGLNPALVARGTLRVRRGEPQTDLAVAADLAYPTDEPQFVCPVAAALAEAYWWSGDVERATAEAKRGLEVAIRAGQPWFIGELAFWLRRFGALGTTPSRVATPFRLLLEGDWQGAAAEWERRDFPYARAEALAFADPPEALRLFDRLGAVVPARRLREELRERGLPVPRGPRAATAADPIGLTARQREVLKLIAEGLSNTDIAARLTLSAKTVDHHVSAVLSKLGVSSRGRAAAWYRVNLGNNPHVRPGDDS
nr:LuxR family transcriptional regulator [uncultured Actinoplanes sp.]